MTTPENQLINFPESEVGLLPAYLRGLPSAATRRVYRQVIRDFEASLCSDVLLATRRHVEAYREMLETRGRKPATIGKHLSAIAGLFDFAVAEGVIDRNPAALARRPKVPDTSPRRALSQSEVREMIAVPDRETLVGLRDRALLTVLAVQGWRISEALGLGVEDLDEEQGQRVAQITGKGGKTVRVPLAAATWAALREWVLAAQIDVGAIFVPVLKGGRVRTGSSMTAQSAWKRVRLIARQAGIGRQVHPHIFRHTAVTEALASGVPLHEVQDYARHADPRTTRRYDSHRGSLRNPTPHILASAFSEDQGSEE